MNIFIAGATSAIAIETARHFAGEGASFFLVARNTERLAAVRDDLIARGSLRVEFISADLTVSSRHTELIESARTKLGAIDLFFLAYGILGDQSLAEHSPAEADRILTANFTSAVSLLTVAAESMIPQNSGTIAVIGSVAGDRGKRSNYVYGAAKAGLETFLEGLRARLYQKNITVVLLKPGFVDTPMTRDIPKNVLFTSAEKAGALIHKAIKNRTEIAYVPGYWRFIMTAISSIPNTLFKRMKL